MYTTILVDDESLTTQALRKVIEVNFPAVEILAETNNGQKAWELIMTQIPDFIISDIRMPELNGLELVQRIRKANLPIKVILVTAYAEFEYAKKAIQLGASGYFLKPFVQTELIQEIFNLTQMIDIEKENHGFKNKVSTVIPFIEENAIKKMLAGKMDSTSLKNFLDVTGNKWNSCYLGVYQLGLLNPNSSEIEEIVKISITEEINNCLLEGGFHGVSFFRKFNELVLAFNHPLEEFPVQEAEKKVMQGCLNIITKYSHEPISVGFSGKEYDLLHLIDAYDVGVSQISTVYDKPILPDNLSFETNSDQKDKLVAKIVEFCQQHFVKDISLQKAADHFNINKNYFCAIFKEKLNVTFWDHITQLRISEAKELLTTTHQKATDIALQIGYINSSHFGRIFKETTGITPAEYRRRNESNS